MGRLRYRKYYEGNLVTNSKGMSYLTDPFSKRVPYLCL